MSPAAAPQLATVPFFLLAAVAVTAADRTFGLPRGDLKLSEEDTHSLSSLNCSLNGRVVNGACLCSAAWSGVSCELLALLPTPANADYDVRASHSHL